MHQGILLISTSVMLHEDFGGSHHVSHTDQPTGAFWRDQEAGERNEGEQYLQQHWDPPRSVRGDVTATERDPATEGAANVLAAHEKGACDGSMRWVGDLVSEHRGRVSEPTESDTDDETGIGKDLFVGSSGMHANSNHQEDVTDIESNLSTPAIRDPSSTMSLAMTWAFG